MTPGDVLTVWWPFTHEREGKPRPVLIVGVTEEGDPGELGILCQMITASPRRLQEPEPHDIYIREWRNAGLRQESLIRTRRLFTPEWPDVGKTSAGRPDVRGRVNFSTLECALEVVWDLLPDLEELARKY